MKDIWMLTYTMRTLLMQILLFLNNIMIGIVGRWGVVSIVCGSLEHNLYLSRVSSQRDT